MTKYSYNEVFEASEKYFCGNKLSAGVFSDKYALRDNDDNYYELTPDDMHDRLASEFARIDSEKYKLDYDERFKLYRDAMDKFARIVPQGSPMCAVGNKHQYMSASNCVVLPAPEDNIGSIMRSGEAMAQLYKRRAGVGMCLSTLRPDGETVSNAAKTTTGAWSFAELYSHITQKVGQKSRRGALILTLDVHHPDVEMFATCKADETKVSGANISIKLSNEFMKAVDNNEEYEQRWPCNGISKISRKVNANQVWNTIIESATNTGDPGLLFWDNILKNLPANCYEEFITQCVNPCAEISLSNFDSCRLTSINLTGYVLNAFRSNASFNFKLFAKDIRLATQMLDNLIDLEIELINRIKKKCTSGFETEIWSKLQKSGKRGRRIGLGTHGLGDALAQLNVKYDSDEAIKIVTKIYKKLRNVAYTQSVDLAKERGAFPVFDWEKEKKCAFIQRLPNSIKSRIKKYGRRNIALLTQAPTGSVSIVSKVGLFDRYNVSSGVEPVFRLSYERYRKINPDDDHVKIDRVDNNGVSWQKFNVFHSNVANYLDLYPENKKNLPKFFVTADKIGWENRIKIQAAEQVFLDHQISSTINLPKGTKSDIVSKIYKTAWKNDLKGITVYVDGSKSVSVLSENDDSGRGSKIIPTEAPKRPKELQCDIMHASVQGTSWTILVGLLDNEPYEIFMGRSERFKISPKYKEGKIVKLKKGNYNLSNATNEILVDDIIKIANNEDGAWTTRLMSMSLRHGIPIEYLVEQLSKDGCVVDINNVLARLLKKYVKKMKAKAGELCPKCGSHDIIYEESCKRCGSCSWAGCG